MSSSNTRSTYERLARPSRVSLPLGDEPAISISTVDLDLEFDRPLGPYVDNDGGGASILSTQHVKVPVGKHCGFVQFVCKADARRAIEKMQGFPIGGSRIRLSWGRNQYKAAQAAVQAAQAVTVQNQAASSRTHTILRRQCRAPSGTPSGDNHSSLWSSSAASPISNAMMTSNGVGGNMYSNVGAHHGNDIGNGRLYSEEKLRTAYLSGREDLVDSQSFASHPLDVGLSHSLDDLNEGGGNNHNFVVFFSGTSSSRPLSSSTSVGMRQGNCQLTTRLNFHPGSDVDSVVIGGGEGDGRVKFMFWLPTMADLHIVNDFHRYTATAPSSAESSPKKLTPLLEPPLGTIHFHFDTPRSSSTVGHQCGECETGGFESLRTPDTPFARPEIIGHTLGD
ncbi:hypothetical protein D9757_013574 [Collybiopsis confluens]|uniref:RRM domain-containing protein n=1 Tax=Collybiopsis confluens TaxID=2823264 RepID=A0A8H5GKJ6_9AGAR|nr:hypothetical protein D9757_013574 [Collybiopsis confluens]